MEFLAHKDKECRITELSGQLLQSVSRFLSLSDILEE